MKFQDGQHTATPEARESASDHAIIKGSSTPNADTDNSDDNDGRQTARGHNDNGADGGAQRKKRTDKAIWSGA